MEWLVDTSVLVRTIDTGSLHQQLAIDALAKLRMRGDFLCTFPKNLVEFWVVSTRPADVNGLALNDEESQRQLDQIKLHFILKREDETIYENWENLIKSHSVLGKAAHDARIVAAMQTHNIANVLTFNTADFVRYEDIVRPVSPEEVIAVAKSDE